MRKKKSATRNSVAISWGLYMRWAVMIIFLAGYCLPYRPIIPVADATNSDWNKKSYWAYPWGRSVTHKGIDIFAPKGKEVFASTGGWVIFSGHDAVGGNVVWILTAKWRIAYYAHLDKNYVHTGQWVGKGSSIGAVGSTGNAAGKPPHLHYALLTPIPYPWRYDSEAPQGTLKMFYLKPDDYF